MRFLAWNWNARGKQEVKNAVSSLHEIKQQITATNDSDSDLQKEIAKEVGAQLDTIIGDLKVNEIDGGVAPEVMLRRGLQALDRTERQYFLITNMIESLKGGRSLKDTLSNMKKCGAVSIDVDRLPEDHQGPTNYGWLSRLLSGLVRFGRGVIKVVMAVLKQLVDRFKDERVVDVAKSVLSAVRPNVGAAGPFPSLSFSIDWESIKLGEVWELLEVIFDRD